MGGVLKLKLTLVRWGGVVIPSDMGTPTGEEKE